MKTVLATIAAILALAAVVYLSFLYVAGPKHPLENGPKELLVYCGITMAGPISEIAQIIEKQEDCKIVVIKGGSGNLLRAIEVNKIGDLYIPGLDSYIESCKKKGLVGETALVGHNQAALLVRKGNPKGISAKLINLTNPDYYVVICDSESGSIGRETRRILERRGIYREVCQNARHLTSDSKDLIKVLKDEEADLVVNWYATSRWPESRPYVDAMPIDKQYASTEKLVLGVLTCSRYPDIAEKFMRYAASEKGKELFREYGLYEPE